MIVETITIAIPIHDCDCEMNATCLSRQYVDILPLEAERVESVERGTVQVQHEYG